MTHTSMDSELTLLGLNAASFRRAGPDEAHGACPSCGGKDRFIVHAIRPWPSWLVMCRVCMPEWKWADEYNLALKQVFTDEQKAAYAAERQQYEQDRASELDRRLKDFTASEIWEAYHRRMSEDNRQWWRTRGVPDDWQDYLQLGYLAEKRLQGGYTTPAYTIPYLRKDSPPITIQYRLTNPPNPNDKYRFEYGLPAVWYETEPTLPLQDEAVICEGAIKAMVTRIMGGLRNNVSILAIPGKSSWAGIIEAVKPCGRVWIILDPDGHKEAHKLAEEIKNSRIVTIPIKVDDALLQGMTPDMFANYFRQARKV